MKYLKIAILLLIAAMAASCSSKAYKEINYVQDIRVDTTMAMNINKGIIIQPQDKLSIVVSTRNTELAQMFNLRSISAGAVTNSSGSGGSGSLGYVVDNDGMITFPQLGRLYVAGMTRWQLQDYIKELLQDGKLLNDAVVTVDFINFKFSVIGEVKSPGTYNFTSDKLSLLQALSMAGDLTIMGKRENVSVIREEGRKRTVYILDLKDSDIFNSPGYYLQQNDVIYVEPNKVRAGQSTLNENSFRSVSFWTSLCSFIMSTVNTAMILIIRSRNL